MQSQASPSLSTSTRISIVAIVDGFVDCGRQARLPAYPRAFLIAIGGLVNVEKLREAVSCGGLPSAHLPVAHDRWDAIRLCRTFDRGGIDGEDRGS
jgi:hypothetical protein